MAACRCWKVSACEVVHRRETAGGATSKHMRRCALGARACGQGPCGAFSLRAITFQAGDPQRGQVRLLDDVSRLQFGRGLRYRHWGSCRHDRAGRRLDADWFDQVTLLPCLRDRRSRTGYAPHRYRLCRVMLNRCRELGRKSYLGTSQGDFCTEVSRLFALASPGLPRRAPSDATRFSSVSDREPSP